MIEKASVIRPAKIDSSFKASTNQSSFQHLNTKEIISFKNNGSQNSFVEVGMTEVSANTHAGENAGSESVWDALDMGVERIDHSVRSIEDNKLLQRLVEIQIPLTVCPVSNVELKIFPNMAEHPIKRLMDAGVFVTVNSDDPSMFDADVVDNYVQVAETFKLTADDIEKLARNSFMVAFMDDITLSNCLHGFTNTVTQLQTEIFNQ